MPKKTTSQQQLLAENAALRARLNEAEETLRTIRGGEADALVVSGAEGDHILALKGGLEPYRVMVEAMGEGAATLAVDGTILYANRRFTDWVKVPPGKIVGLPLQGMLAEQDREGFDAMLVRGAEGDIREVLTLQAADGTQTPALFSMCPLPQSAGKVISIVIADLSEVVAAAEARSRLALIVESSDDAIVSTTLDGVVESWNRAAEQLYGYTAGEALGQPITSLIIPPDRSNEVKAEFEAVRRGERTLFEDSVRLRKDGTRVEVSIKASPILDDAGTVVGASINARDITERKRAELALLWRTAFFEALVKTSEDGILVVDAQGKKILQNQRLNDLFSIPEDIAANPDDSPQLQFVIDQVVDAKQFGDKVRYLYAHPEEISQDEVALKNGTILDRYSAPVLDSDGLAYGRIWTFHDITERKLAEDVIRKRTQLLEEAQEISRMGNWEWNAASNASTWSREMYILFDRDPDASDVTLENFLESPHPDDRARVQQIIRKSLENLEPADLEFRFITSSGKIRWIHDKFEIEADSSGKPSRLYGTCQDITEHKQNEDVLRRANRALQTLSAGNLALVRAASEDELLKTITSVIVEQGGYVQAGVHYAEDGQESSLTSKAWSGDEVDHFCPEYLGLADSEQGQLPIAKAIRSGKTQICHDIALYPAFQPFKDRAVELGYVANIALPLSDGKRTFGGLCIYASAANAFDDEEVLLLEELANDLAYGIVTLRARIEQSQHATILRQSLEQSIETIADTVGARDPYTAGHQRRVAELATAIAREMDLPEDQVNGIHLAAIIHDLGKIHVPAEILSKPGRLTDIELMLVRTHPQDGYDILKNVKFPWPIAEIILQHHEKLDGSGYPQGLKGEQILPESRILTVADIVEAMSSHRPYRAALGIEPALEEIRRGRGSEYDPAAVDACLRLFTEKGFAFSSQAS